MAGKPAEDTSAKFGLPPRGPGPGGPRAQGPGLGSGARARGPGAGPGALGPGRPNKMKNATSHRALFMKFDSRGVEAGGRNGAEANGAGSEGGIANGCSSPQGLCNVSGEAMGLRMRPQCSLMSMSWS